MRTVFREQKISSDNHEHDEHRFGFEKRALSMIFFMLILMFVRHVFHLCEHVGQRMTPCRSSNATDTGIWSVDLLISSVIR
jgi:hypothetical protein